MANDELDKDVELQDFDKIYKYYSAAVKMLVPDDEVKRNVIIDNFLARETFEVVNSDEPMNEACLRLAGEDSKLYDQGKLEIQLKVNKVIEDDKNIDNEEVNEEVDEKASVVEENDIDDSKESTNEEIEKGVKDGIEAAKKDIAKQKVEEELEEKSVDKNEAKDKADKVVEEKGSAITKEDEEDVIEDTAKDAADKEAKDMLAEAKSKVGVNAKMTAKFNALYADDPVKANAEIMTPLKEGLSIEEYTKAVTLILAEEPRSNTVYARYGKTMIPVKGDRKDPEKLLTIFNERLQKDASTKSNDVSMDDVKTAPMQNGMGEVEDKEDPEEVEDRTETPLNPGDFAVGAAIGATVGAALNNDEKENEEDNKDVTETTVNDLPKEAEAILNENKNKDDGLLKGFTDEIVENNYSKVTTVAETQLNEADKALNPEKYAELEAQKAEEKRKRDEEAQAEFEAKYGDKEL